MGWYHPEEEEQFGSVWAYEQRHPGARYFVAFPDGESYVCRFFAAYESDNSGELGIDEDDPRYDEFFQVDFDVLEIVRDGPRRYHEARTIDYRDFPERIVDVDAGAVVYPEGEAAGGGHSH